MECGMIEIIGLVLIFAVCLLFIGLGCLYADFIFWIATGKEEFYQIRKISDKLVTVCAVFVLAFDFPDDKDWRVGSPVFAPPDQPVLLIVVLACFAAYVYSTSRKKLGPAILEVAVNFLLLIALILNVATGIQEDYSLSWVGCTIPLCILLVMTLARNYRIARNS